MKRRGHYLLVDGVKMPICFQPSPAMARAMRDGMTPSRKYVVEDDDATAVAYAEWLCRRDGVAIPKVEAGAWGKLRTIVERDYCDAPGLQRARWRPRAVRWESGGKRSQMLYNARGKFKGYGPEQWECDAIMLRVEIPNWDHVATVQEHAQQEIAA